MKNYPVPLGKKGGSLRSLAMYILVVFSLLAVFGLFFLPLWKLAEVAFVEEGRLSLRIFWELLTDTKTLKVIWDTIYINVLSVLLRYGYRCCYGLFCGLCGYPWKEIHSLRTVVAADYPRLYHHLGLDAIFCQERFCGIFDPKRCAGSDHA